MDDGIVLLPKAGGLSPEQLMQQQDIINQEQAQLHSEAQIRNLSLHSGTLRAAASLQGIMTDWIAGRRSLHDLLLSNNRLQGIGLILVALALSGLLIDTVLAW